MGVRTRYGKFPRGVAIISGAMAVYLALIALISHPLGFVGSAVVLLAWGVFLRLLAFAFEPESFKILTEPKKRAAYDQDVAPNELPDVSGIVAAATRPLAQKDRILGGSAQYSTSSGRIVDGVHQERDYRSEERVEDKEWAEMLRAL
jgi:hypothetical protein